MGAMKVVTWASSAGPAYDRQRERRHFDIEFLTGQWVRDPVVCRKNYLRIRWASRRPGRGGASATESMSSWRQTSAKDLIGPAKQTRGLALAASAVKLPTFDVAAAGREST